MAAADAAADVAFLTDGDSFDVAVTSASAATVDYSQLNVTANKYYKLTVTETVTNSATGVTGATVTAEYKSGGTKIGAETFVKATDQVVITLTSSEAAGTKPTQAVKVSGTIAGATSVTATGMANIETTTSFGGTDKVDVTATIGGEATGGTGTATIEISLGD